MNAVVKLIMGFLVLVAGLAWYWYGSVFEQFIGINSVQALMTMFIGAFGLLLVLFGFLVVWIEMEEIKDMQEEKKREKEKPMIKEVKKAIKKPAKKSKK